MTIQHKLDGRMARAWLHDMGYTDDEAKAFMNYKLMREDGLPQTYISSNDGLQAGVSLVALQIVRPDGKYYDDFYAYVRMEPLTVITGEKHIALFECSPENIQSLQDEFRTFMVGFLDLDGTNNSINKLAEFSGWDANRVDYTRDIHFRNHDEALAFMNLCKLLTRESGYNHALTKMNTYGVNFTNEMYKFGNKTWELEIYDKQSQVRNRKNRYVEQNYAEDVFHQLVDESQNVLRFEYRRKNRGTRKASTKFDDKNIMRFLSEEVADQWFHKAYGSCIGYEPFYVLGHPLKKILSEAFPMNKKDLYHEGARRRRYQKAHEKAKKDGITVPQAYRENLMGTLAQQYYSFQSFVSSHKGLMNAEASFADFEYANKRKFQTWIDNLRAKGIAPVCIPKNWLYIRPNGNGRAMDLPHDFLPNPIARPEND